MGANKGYDTTGGMGHPSISWKKPGAVHKARFMANGLYSNFVFAFKDILEHDAKPVSTLRHFVNFNAPHFLSAGVGADAAFDDLKLYKKALQV
jgi:hypothetical protein